MRTLEETEKNLPSLNFNLTGAELKDIIEKGLSAVKKANLSTKPEKIYQFIDIPKVEEEILGKN